MKAEPSVVQVEFFHVGGKQIHSLEDLFTEIASILGDNIEVSRKTPSIKSVVRFRDHKGKLTKLAVAYEKADGHYRKLRDRCLSPECENRWLVERLMRYTGRRRASLHKKITTLSIKDTVAAFDTNRPLAVETTGHRFRYLDDAERSELREAVQSASGSWLFVFEPNGNLLADKNCTRASVMHPL